MMTKKQLYLEKMDAQMREWSAQLDALRAKADQAKAEARIEAIDRIEVLKVTGEDFKAKLAEIKEAGEESWDELKTGLDNAWQTLKDAFVITK